MRPQTLVEVASFAEQTPSEFKNALDEFLDDFYLDNSVTGRSERIRTAPDTSTLDRDTGALLAAVAEHLSYRWGLDCPPWVEESEFMGGNRPKFYPDDPVIRPILLVESPPAFRRRLIFTGAEPLARARFPGDHQVIMPFER
jgi:hypothetical protein